MAEIDFTFKFLGDKPVRGGRIDETIPPRVVRKALEQKPVMISDAAVSRYFDLRLEEHEICHESLETGWSAGKLDKLKAKREEIREIEERNPSVRREFTDNLSLILNNFI